MLEICASLSLTPGPVNSFNNTLLSALPLVHAGHGGTLPSLGLAHQTLDKNVEALETELLNKFDHAFKLNDLSCMHDMADVCYELNGGQSCVRRFLSVLPVFVGTADSLIQYGVFSVF